MSDLLLMRANKIVVFDGFNRVDNALTLGNADTGQVWTAHTGTFGIKSNGAYVSSVAALNFATVPALANFNGEILLNYSTAGLEGGLVFRFADTDNLYFAYMGTSRLGLYRKKGGAGSIVAQYNMTPSVGTVYKISVIALNTTIIVKLNDVVRINFTDNDFQGNTRIGMYIYNQNILTLDSLRVEAI